MAREAGVIVADRYVLAASVEGADVPEWRAVDGVLRRSVTIVFPPAGTERVERREVLDGGYHEGAFYLVVPVAPTLSSVPGTDDEPERASMPYPGTMFPTPPVVHEDPTVQVDLSPFVPLDATMPIAIDLSMIPGGESGAMPAVADGASVATDSATNLALAGGSTLSAWPDPAATAAIGATAHTGTGEPDTGDPDTTGTSVSDPPTRWTRRTLVAASVGVALALGFSGAGLTSLRNQPITEPAPAAADALPTTTGSTTTTTVESTTTTEETPTTEGPFTTVWTPPPTTRPRPTTMEPEAVPDTEPPTTATMTSAMVATTTTSTTDPTSTTVWSAATTSKVNPSTPPPEQ